MATTSISQEELLGNDQLQNSSFSRTTTSNSTVEDGGDEGAVNSVKRFKRSKPKPIVYLVVGGRGCGKTTFLEKLTRTEPEPGPHPHPHPSHIPYIITNKNPRAQGLSPELYFFEDEVPTNLEQDDIYGYDEVKSPDIIIICFDIGNKSKLDSVIYLITEIESKYNINSGIFSIEEEPVLLLLGLKRDLRVIKDIDIDIGNGNESVVENGNGNGNEFEFVLPIEGLEIARKFGLKRYMECSCLTGELVEEVAEDVVEEGIKKRMEEMDRVRADRGADSESVMGFFGGRLGGEAGVGLGNCVVG